MAIFRKISECRHNVTRPGVDHIGPYVECVKCRERGRQHLHKAQVLSFGPAYEPIEARCPFCEAQATGANIILWEHPEEVQVYVRGVKVGIFRDHQDPKHGGAIDLFLFRDGARPAFAGTVRTREEAVAKFREAYNVPAPEEELAG